LALFGTFGDILKILGNKMFKKYILKNGITLALVPIKNAYSVTINIIAKTGFRTESKNQKGIAHLLEHMFFKGGKKYPKSIDVAEAIDGKGGQFNAGTDVEYTNYWIKINPSYLEIAFDVLSDMLIKAQFKNKELLKEKNVILEELNMFKNDPNIYSQTLIEDLLFKKSPLAFDLEKQTETIKKIERKSLLDFINKYYYPENLVICIAGNFELNQTIKYANKYFKNLVSKKKRIGFNKYKDDQKAPRVKIVSRTDISQMFIQLAFKSVSRESSYFFPMQILHATLGASMSSRLFINVREKHGLCYDIHTFEEGYTDTGVFGISLVTSKPKKALELINHEIIKIKKKKIDQKEMQKAKELINGKTLLRLEDTFFNNMFWAEQTLLSKKQISPKDYIKRINQVNPKDVLELSNLIFQKNKINLAIVGPYNKIDPFIKELKF
jgi:predicted Zn-dependent peptidase